MLDSNTGKILMIILVIALILFAFVYILIKLLGVAQNKVAKNQQAPKQKPEKVKKEKKEKKAKVKKEKKSKQTEQAPVQEEIQGPSDSYVSPLILDRSKYEIALQERLERERKEKFNRQAAETARLEALKNKEFQSHAGYITTLQRFSKKETLEKQLAEEGKVDKDLLGVYLNEKGNTISDEFNNMSPELKAVILSDLMNRKY